MNHHIICNDNIDGDSPSPATSAVLVNSSPLPIDHCTSARDRLSLFTTTSPQTPIAAATPSPTNHHHYHQRGGAPEMVSILATSTPEIETLMSSPFEFLERPNSHNSLNRQTSATTVLDDKDFNHLPATMMMMMATKTPAATEKRHVPRVSLSPPHAGLVSPLTNGNNNNNCSNMKLPEPSNGFQRSPLDDITRSLCRVRLTPSPPPSSGGSSSSSSSSSQRSAPMRARGQLRKPSLHRRVSFDVLPSPSEIGDLVVSPGRSASMSSIPTSVSPAKGRRHRRNTTVFVLSSHK